MSDPLTDALNELQLEADARRQQAQAGQTQTAPPPPAGGETGDSPPQSGQPGNQAHVSPFDILRLTLSGVQRATGVGVVGPQVMAPNLTAEAARREVPQGAVHGAIGAVNETVNAAADVGTGLGNAAATPEVLSFLNPNKQDAGGAIGRGVISFSRVAHQLGFGTNQAPNLPNVAEPDTFEGRAASAVSQTIVGYLAAGRVFKAFGVPEGVGLTSRFARSAAQGALGDFAAFDGNQERLSNLIESVPALRNPVTAYLAASPTDSAVEGRLKNVLEGLGIGTLAEGFLTVLRGTKAALAGDKAAVNEATDALEAEVSQRAEATKTQRATQQQAQAAAQTRPPTQRGPLASLVEGVRQRIGLGGRDTTGAAVSRAHADLTAAQDLAAFKREAGDKAARAVDLSDLPDNGTDWKDGSPFASPEAMRRQDAARSQAEAQAETEFKAQRAASSSNKLTPEEQARLDTLNAKRIRTESEGEELALLEHKASGSRGPIGSAPEVPEGVFRSKDDVQNFLDEVEGNREHSGQLNIKPDTDAAATAAHGEWTLDTLGSPEKLDATLRALVDRTAEKTTRSDASLMSDALDAADELGQTPETTLAAGMHIAGIAGNIDTAVQTMRTLWKRTSATVDAHVGRDLSMASDEEFSNVVQSIHNALTFSNYMAQVKSAMGRGLRVFKLPDADAYVHGILNERERVGANGGPAVDPSEFEDRTMVPLPRNRQEASDWLELWGLTRDNPQARSDFLEGLQAVPGQWKYLRNSFANLFTANILSGVPSIMLNVVGPALIGGLRTIEKTTGGFMASLLPWIPAARRAELRTAAANSAVAYTQAFGDIKDVFNYARSAAEQGHSILGGGGSVSDRAAQFGPITEGMLRAQQIEPGFGYWAGNVVNMWPSVFSRLNNGLDEFAKRLSYLGEARARALTQGVTQGLTGDELAAFVSENVRSKFDAVGAATDENLLAAAEKTTFTGTPGAEGSKGRQIANLINDWRAQTPEVRYILPIFNVPANSLGETLTRIPVVNYALKETREALLGNHGAVAQAEAHGRMLLGAGMLTAGFYMSRSGQLTGAGPQDPRDRAVWLQTHQPYSIRIGDQWVDYSRYDILGSLLGIPATVFDRSVHTRQDMNWMNMMAAGAASLSEFFRDRAALQTASDFLSFGNKGQSPQAFVDRTAGGVASRMIMPNWMTQVGRQLAGDNEARTKTSAFSYILDNIPLASGTLDPQRNIWGEPIHRPKDTLFENLAPITLTPASVYAHDPQTDELERLYEATGYAPGVTQHSDVDGGFYDSRDVHLEDGHSLYDAIIRARTDVQIDGLTLRQAAQELFNSDDYADAVDGDASNRETSNGDTSRGYLIGRIFHDYNEAAKHQVAQESDTAARYLAVTAAKRTDDASLRNYSAEQLARTRGLAEALGIDMDQYISQARGE